MTSTTQEYVHQKGIKYSILSDGNLGIGDILDPETWGNGIYDSSLITPKLVIPPVIENRKVTKLLNRSFSHCNLFREIKLPYTLIEICACAMNDNYLIRSLFIPASVEKIEIYGIAGLKKCKTLIFEEGSRLSNVGYGAWDSNLVEEITLPFSITSFADCVFAKCSKLKRLYICFDLMLTNSTNTFIKCPDDVKIYVKHTYESDYFGGRKVTKIDSCGTIQQYHLSNKCTNKFTVHRINYITLALMTLSLS